MSEIRNLINITDLTVEEIDRLIAVADDIVAHHSAYENICAHKKLATLFFEPSTRTRLSFEAAMLELGGSVLGFSEANSSSAAKGESVSDTVRTVGCYADIIAMRHPKEGAPIVAAQRTTVPIINGGDGGHFHPTQTLTDLLTIKRKKGRLSDMTIGLCGDLKFGRTVHSLIEAMLRYEGIRFVYLSAGAAGAGLRQGKDGRGWRGVERGGVSRRGDAGTRHSLHDSRTERAFLQ